MSVVAILVTERLIHDLKTKKDIFRKIYYIISGKTMISPGSNQLLPENKKSW